MTQKSINLESISDEDLLSSRICDLPLHIENTWLEECIKQLHEELSVKGIAFNPPCYLADEWLTPTGETCIGIPFYLAHPRLISLERKYMIDAEGDSKSWCMKLLRHETGHAIAHAFNLQKRRSWQKMFGSAKVEYGETYKYRPYSKNYVRHLDGYYAQYHPDEDFCETFAVWLTPNFDWKTQYKGWKALDKLNYVDGLMGELKGELPPNKSAKKFWRLSTLKLRLKHYYAKKRNFLAEDFPDFHDRFLLKVFQIKKDVTSKEHTNLSQLIRRNKKTIIYYISRSSGEHKYIISELLKGVEQRARELDLVTVDTETNVVLSLTAYITAMTMNYLYTGRFRGNHKHV